MTIFFNLEVLERVSNGNTQDLRNLLYYHYVGKPARMRGQKASLSHINLRGKSYLLNPQPLFEDSSTDPLYVSQYIRLAGRRSYAHYKFYSAKYLDLSFYPELDIDAIKHNPLLNITDSKIYFKYEEN